MGLDQYLQEIRQEQGLTTQVPGFDEQNGNELARFLFVLEAPGPKAVETGVVSTDNPDPTARNLGLQLKKAGVPRADIAIWNTIPWYIGNDERTRIRTPLADDLNLGIGYLIRLLPLLANLKCIVLVGGAARKAHVALSSATRARILSCHHTSARAMNSSPTRAEENMRVFEYMINSVDA